MRIEEGIQFGLRGIDPFNGKIVPYEIETIEGKGVRTQECVDNKIQYNHVVSEGRKRIEQAVSVKPQQ